VKRPWNYRRRALADGQWQLENWDAVRWDLQRTGDEKLKLIREALQMQLMYLRYHAGPAFALPEGGRLLDVRPFDVVHEGEEELRLPFESFQLEYPLVNGDERGDLMVQVMDGKKWLDIEAALRGKTVEQALEESEEKGVRARHKYDDCVVLFPWLYRPSQLPWWSTLSPIWLDLKRYAKVVPGKQVMLQFDETSRWEGLFDESSYLAFLAPVVEFLKVMECGNVRTHKTPARPLSNTQKRKGALPFDDHWTLVLGDNPMEASRVPGTGSHRSPREHMRRGHIRRYENGTKTWVRSCVVNPGAAGRVEKDYVVKKGGKL
jgi:hypothetical protein